MGCDSDMNGNGNGARQSTARDIADIYITGERRPLFHGDVDIDGKY